MNTTLPPAGFFRRLGALIYDSLIVLAILMIAGGVVVALMEALVAAGLVSYAPYQDASDLLTGHPIWSPAYTLYLALAWLSFFVYFWNFLARKYILFSDNGKTSYAILFIEKQLNLFSKKSKQPITTPSTNKETL